MSEKNALNMSDEEFAAHRKELIAAAETKTYEKLEFEKSPLQMSQDEWNYARAQMKRQNNQGLIKTPSHSQLEEFKRNGY